MKGINYNYFSLFSFNTYCF